ncbi:dephospho-CoA kinase [Dyadobacter sp. CY261]|uniref:dephospho-CoA kinase n=1 Tax=Dyadobacter sp. CY261 TaxID=2907203 RepID=UPI001EEA5689|nr:dephospho-CoA kinase [Dyadobacter sp. CY261]MCF0073272.1 dephospho-CoA kinase [Dyadobacter sp. CY261]
MKLPLLIGVTGGIGSGKSMVCRLFECLEIPVYYADSRAKWLTNHDPGIREKVVALLGPEAYDKGGLYNTKLVASKVFGNEPLLKGLNEIIHPVVLRDTKEWVTRHAGTPYVVKEAAIMAKAGQANATDYVVVVEAPVELRIQRILRRDNRTQQEIRAIIERQVSDDSRREIADYIVNNDDTSALIPQVLHLHEIFLKGKSALL